MYQSLFFNILQVSLYICCSCSMLGVHVCRCGCAHVCVCIYVNRNMFKPEINVGCLSQSLLTISVDLFLFLSESCITEPRTHRFVCEQTSGTQHLILYVVSWDLNLGLLNLMTSTLLVEPSPQPRASIVSATLLNISGYLWLFPKHKLPKLRGWVK